MSEFLKDKAKEIIKILNEVPAVKNCKIYGSLFSNTCDELSDIDIEVDVSGTDNGQFMLSLVEFLKDKVKIYYSDYAPSLIPDAYIVSVAIDETNPFLVVDLRCSASPHCTTVTREEVAGLNNKFSHILKLWTANLKHFARKVDCFGDIVRMSTKINIDTYGKDEKQLLHETLLWLENNAQDNLLNFVKSCRNKFEELI